MGIKFSIVYHSDIYDVNGINYVTNYFVKAKSIYAKNNIDFRHIYCSNGVIDVKNIDFINIGKDVGTKMFSINRFVRSTLSKVMDSSLPFNAWFKVKKSILNPAMAVVNNNIHKINQEEILLFQDIFTAYYYITNKERNTSIKTVLLLHCSEEPFEQLISYYPSLKTSKYYDFLSKIKDTVYDKIDEVIFLSKNTLNYNQIISHKSKYIYNGIPDIEHFIEEDEFFNITCVGSIVGRKGQDILINSIKLLPDNVLKKVKLHIIGGGPEETKLKIFVKENKLENNIVFYGVRNDIDILLRKMDVMVLASKSEGMPISIIEGMRQGMFILATDVGAIAEMIDPSYGSLIDRNANDIKNKIISVFNKENKDYKVNSRNAFLEKFTIESMSEQYCQLFLELSNDK